MLFAQGQWVERVQDGSALGAAGTGRNDDVSAQAGTTTSPSRCSRMPANPAENESTVPERTNYKTSSPSRLRTISNATCNPSDFSANSTARPAWNWRVSWPAPAEGAVIGPVLEPFIKGAATIANQGTLPKRNSYAVNGAARTRLEIRCAVEDFTHCVITLARMRNKRFAWRAALSRLASPDAPGAALRTELCGGAGCSATNRGCCIATRLKSVVPLRSKWNRVHGRASSLAVAAWQARRRPRSGESTLIAAREAVAWLNALVGDDNSRRSP